MVNESMYGDDETQMSFLGRMFSGGQTSEHTECPALFPMLAPEHVLGLEFTGKFQRDHGEAVKEEDYWNKHGGNPAEYQRTYGVLNAQHEFKMWPFYYNPESGLFVAHGRDVFGDSGITGLMRNGGIKFIKAYVREGGRNHSLLSTLDVIDDYACFRLIECSGELLRPESGLVPARGRYKIYDRNESYNGHWTLDSCQPARFPVLE